MIFSNSSIQAFHNTDKDLTRDENKQRTDITTGASRVKEKQNLVIIINPLSS
jgi:hypothetical protein